MAERTREEREVDGRPAERDGYHDQNRLDGNRNRVDGDHESVRRERTAGPAVAQQRQRDEYGGFNFGAAFFGWLVAVGLAVLLTALLSAAGAAIGLTQLTEGEGKANAETISIVGGILLIVVLAVSQHPGGALAGGGRPLPR